MSILVRLLREDEFELANNFFNRIYGTSRSIENFRWEFSEGPNGKAIYIGAIDSTISDSIKVVGIQCAIPLELISSKNEVILTAKSEDTLVDPEYRGQKIFERMYDLLFEECKKAGILYIWGFTPAVKAFERLGFQIPFQAHQALMIFNPVAAFKHLSSLNSKNSIVDKLKIFGLSFLVYFKSITRHITSINNKIQATGGSDSSFIHFCTESEYLTLNETSQYIEWRLVKNPFNNSYETFQFIHEGRTVANVVLNRRKNVGYIERVFFQSDLSVQIKKQIIKKGLQILIAKKVDLVRSLCFDTNKEMQSQTELLESLGFFILKRGNHFVWKSLDQADRIKANQLLLNRLFLQGNM